MKYYIKYQILRANIIWIFNFNERASIDCRFNELDNKMSGDDFECFEFAEGASEEVEYSTTLNIANADKDAHKDVKVEKRLDKYINIEFPTPFKK